MQPIVSIKKSLITSLLISSGIMSATNANNPSSHPHHTRKLEAKIEEIVRELNELKKAKAEKESANSKTLSVGNDRAKISLSGWINRAAAYYNNGYNSELKHVDTNAQSSRTTLAGEGKFNDLYKAGFILQLEYISESSKAVDIGNASGASKFGAQAFSINKRIIEAYTDTPFGRLSLGQGESATNKLMDLDLSGTNVVEDGLELSTPAGGVRFATARGGYTQPNNTAVSANVRFLRVQDVYNEILGVKRYDRIRYDTPQWKGFILSAAHGVRDRSDFTLKYAGEFNKTKIIAGMGWFHDAFPGINTYASPQDGGTTVGSYLRSVNQYGGSFSMLFPIGISIGGGYACQQYKEVRGLEGRKNGRTWGIKLGYQRSFFEIGKTAFSIAYGESYRVMANAPAVGATTSEQRYGGDNSAKARVWGTYLVQNIDRWGAEVYLAWQTHKLSIHNGISTAVSGTNYNITTNTLASAAATRDMPLKSISSVLMGTRIKF